MTRIVREKSPRRRQGFGDRRFGGGWAAQTSTAATQHYLDIMGLQRTSKDTWQVSVVNATGTQQGVTAIALCGKGSAPKTVTATQKIPAVNGSNSKTVTATCPSGKEAVFGGFEGDYMISPAATPSSSASRSPQSGRSRSREGGTAWEGNNQASRLTAIAYCR